jgi:hypothetical protein
MSKIWDAMKQAERERELHVVPDDVAARPLSARQLSALTALADAATIGEASRRSGISERTLKRWMSEPRFMATYRRISFARCGEAVASLQAASVDAVRVLREALGSSSAAVRVRAAVSILDLAIRAELGQNRARAAGLASERTARARRSKQNG